MEAAKDAKHVIAGGGLTGLDASRVSNTQLNEV